MSANFDFSSCLFVQNLYELKKKMGLLVPSAQSQEASSDYSYYDSDLYTTSASSGAFGNMTSESRSKRVSPLCFAKKSSQEEFAFFLSKFSLLLMINFMKMRPRKS